MATVVGLFLIYSDRKILEFAIYKSSALYFFFSRKKYQEKKDKKKDKTKSNHLNLKLNLSLLDTYLNSYKLLCKQETPDFVVNIISRL